MNPEIRKYYFPKKKEREELNPIIDKLQAELIASYKGEPKILVRKRVVGNESLQAALMGCNRIEAKKKIDEIFEAASNETGVNIDMLRFERNRSSTRYSIVQKSPETKEEIEKQMEMEACKRIRQTVQKIEWYEKQKQQNLKVVNGIQSELDAAIDEFNKLRR